MDIKIHTQGEKKLLNRTDYVVRIHKEGTTPNRLVLLDAFAKHFKTQNTLVIINQIRPVFGASAAIVRLSVYKDAKSLATYEREFTKKRHASPAKDAPTEQGDA